MPWNQIFFKKGCWIPYLWVPWTVHKIYRKKTLLLGNAQNALPKRRLRKWILKTFFFFFFFFAMWSINIILSPNCLDRMMLYNMLKQKGLQFALLLNQYWFLRLQEKITNQICVQTHKCIIKTNDVWIFLWWP